MLRHRALATETKRVLACSTRPPVAASGGGACRRPVAHSARLGHLDRAPQRRAVMRVVNGDQQTCVDRFDGITHRPLLALHPADLRCSSLIESIGGFCRPVRLRPRCAGKELRHPDDWRDSDRRSSRPRGARRLRARGPETRPSQAQRAMRLQSEVRFCEKSCSYSWLSSRAYCDELDDRSALRPAGRAPSVVVPQCPSQAGEVLRPL